MDKNAKEKDPQIDAATLARYLWTSESEILALEASGVLNATGKGKNKKFHTAQAIQEYCEYLRKRAKGYKERQEEKELEKLKEEVRYKEAKAELEEIELQILKGEIHAAEDVEFFTAELVFNARAMLLALPGRLAMDAAEEQEEKRLGEMIGKEIEEIALSLREYSYCLEDYQKRVKERNGLKQIEESEAAKDE